MVTFFGTISTLASSGGLTIILVQIPRTYVPLTSTYQGSTTSPITQFTPTITGQTATQVLLVPDNYLIATVLYDGASTVTSIQTPATSSGATTLVVIIPRTYFTSTPYYVGSPTSLSTAFNPTQTGKPGS